MNTSTVKAPRRSRALALAVAGALGAALFTTGADASQTSFPARGTITAQALSGPSCLAPAGLCFVGAARGSLNGPAEFDVATVTPSASPGVMFVSGTLTVHDHRGDLFCTEEAVLNTSAGSDGEFVFLCEITGGTGKWSGASGYLQALGTVDPATGEGTGEYSGKILLP